MKLTTVDLYKSFGDKPVLNGVSLTAEGGKALGLLGRNGAGKTTTIRIIMRVFSADSGQVLLDGEPLDTDKIKIGYLPEERGLYPKKEVMTQLVYFGELAGLSKKQARSSAERLLEKLQVSQYANQKLETLSKGNAQKIQLAATLLADPDIVILDEPFSGLDPVNAMLLKDLIKETIAKGKIVFFSSHQMNYIEEFCDDIAIMSGGRIVLSGNIDDIKREYARAEIDIAADNAASILDYLKTVHADRIVRGEIDGDTIHLKLEKESDKAFIFSSLSQFAGEIKSFGDREPSLNEIFVKFTEDRI